MSPVSDSKKDLNAENVSLIAKGHTPYAFKESGREILDKLSDGIRNKGAFYYE